MHATLRYGWGDSRLRQVFKCVFFGLLIAVVCPVPAWAKIQVLPVDGVLYRDHGITEEGVQSGLELVPVENVTSEILHLETVLPGLHEQDWKVYVIQKRVRLPDYGYVQGVALADRRAAYVCAGPNNAELIPVRRRLKTWVPVAAEVHPLLGNGSIQETNDSIFIYRWEEKEVECAVFTHAAPYRAAAVAAHEIGHLVQFFLLGDAGLTEYMRLRGIVSGSGTWEADPREIFAEDFRWLFGSEDARALPYCVKAPEPGIKEKEWLLRKLYGKGLSVSSALVGRN